MDAKVNDRVKVDPKRFGFGFAGKNPENYKREDPFLGKFVCFEQNGHTVLGVLDNINTAEGRAEFMPYVVGKGDGHLAIVEDDHTTMDFPLLIKRTMSGTINEYVKDYNKELDRKRGAGENNGDK